jgi:hypothetical protein
LQIKQLIMSILDTIKNNKDKIAGAAIAGAGSTVSNFLSGGNHTGVGDTVNTLGQGLAQINPVLGGIAMAAGTAINGLFGSNINQEFVNQTKANIANMNNWNTTATDNNSLLADASSMGVLGRVSKSDVGSDGLFSNKAGKLTRKLNTQIGNANLAANMTLGNAAGNIDAENDFNALANLNALGGLLSPDFNNFNNGIKFIGNGGTHEQNPYEGVPMGVDKEGTPNLVEEGEVIWNDYVFSKRLMVPDAIRNKYKLRGSKNLSFADAVTNIQKESEQRPNDPISKNTLNVLLGNLMQSQEVLRQQEEAKKVNKKANGGNLFYDGSYLPKPDLTLKEKFTGFGVTGNPFNKNTSSNSGGKTYQTWLRYAPVVGSAIGLTQGLLSKPDYSNADLLMNAATTAGNYQPVSFNPIGNYLTYTPFDRDYYTNKLNAEAGATRRALVDQGGGNRANVAANILAADYNAQGKMGDLFRQAEEYNFNNRNKVEEFNRATNQYNSEAALKAAMANQEARLKASQTRLSGIQAAVDMRNKIDLAKDAAIAGNFTSLFQNLGNIGTDEVNRRDAAKRISTFESLDLDGIFKYNTPEKALKIAREKGYTDDELRRAGHIKANGGKLKTKKKGLTI